MPHIAPPPLIAQASTSPTLQRLQQLQQADSAAKAAEAKNWRTFPKPLPPGPAIDPANPIDLNALIRESAPLFNPLATGSWLDSQDRAPDESCSYFWPGWKLDPATGIRHTQMRCKRSYHRAVAVNCSTLQLTTSDFSPAPPPSAQAARSYQRWHHWRLPANLGQEQLVAALCDNI